MVAAPLTQVKKLCYANRIIVNMSTGNQSAYLFHYFK